MWYKLGRYLFYWEVAVRDVRLSRRVIIALLQANDSDLPLQCGKYLGSNRLLTARRYFKSQETSRLISTLAVLSGTERLEHRRTDLGDPQRVERRFCAPSARTWWPASSARGGPSQCPCDL